MFRRDHHERRTEDRIRARREYADAVAVRLQLCRCVPILRDPFTGDGEVHERAFTAADPVLLRLLRRFRPVDPRNDFRSRVVPQLKTNSFRDYADAPLNNATLIGTRLYYQHLDLFERVYQRYNQDLRRASEEIMRAARGNEKDPFGAVEALVAGS